MRIRRSLFQAIGLAAILSSGCGSSTLPRNTSYTPTHAIDIDGDMTPVYPGDLLLDVLRRIYPASSLGVNAQEPDVVVDGILTSGVRWLALAAAADIASVRRMRAVDAFHSYGTRSRVGAIVVRTRRGGT